MAGRAAHSNDSQCQEIVFLLKQQIIFFLAARFFFSAKEFFLAVRRNFLFKEETLLRQEDAYVNHIKKTLSESGNIAVSNKSYKFQLHFSFTPHTVIF